MNQSDSTQRSLPQKLALLGGPVLALLIFLFFDLKPGSPAVTATLALAVWMAVWWISEAVPIAVTSLLPVAFLGPAGAVDGGKIASSYFNSVIFLFMGGFLVALAMEKWKLHKRIALRILSLVGPHPGAVLFGFMSATAFLSMWISNTATAMMMVPIAGSVIRGLKETEANEHSATTMGKGIMLGVAYSASIGGMATLIGTPPNLSLSRIYSILFPDARALTFADWLVFALPPSILMFWAAWTLLFFLYRPAKGLQMDRDFFREQYAQLGSIRFEEKAILILSASMALLWIFRSGFDIPGMPIPGWSSLFPNPSYIDDGTVAIAIAILLFVIPSKSRPGETLLDWQTARNLPWRIILLFGGGFALATAFAESGLSHWFGERLSFVAGAHPLLLLLALSTMISLLTELTSNPATTEMILPVLAGISMNTDLEPLFLMIPATMVASLAFMLPVATPPNAVVYGSGHLQMKDMIRTGFFLNITGVLVISLFMQFAGPLFFPGLK